MSLVYAAIQALALWVGVIVQASFMASLGEPWASVPLMLVAGIILLHERSLPWGVWWLVMSGILLEWRGLGFGLTLAYTGAAIITVLLVTSVFAKRSLAGLFGVAVVGAISFLLLRCLGDIIWNVAHAEDWFLGLSLRDFLFVSIVVPVLVVAVSVARRRLARIAGTSLISRDDIYGFSSTR